MNESIGIGVGIESQLELFSQLQTLLKSLFPESGVDANGFKAQNAQGDAARAAVAYAAKVAFTVVYFY